MTRRVLFVLLWTALFGVVSLPVVGFALGLLVYFIQLFFHNNIPVDWIRPIQLLALFLLVGLVGFYLGFSGRLPGCKRDPEK
jgi:hypothetical protein